jgi:hypothetical protein
VSDDYISNPVERYWLIHANGGRQLIDPHEFDLACLAEQARRIGGRLEVERWVGPVLPGAVRYRPPDPQTFEPPISALPRLFRVRLDRVHTCKVGFYDEFNTRPTNRVLGNYYRHRRLVRIYTHDTELGRRPMEELFDTYLHEVAHHLEYTEYESFDADGCGRVPGRMHSRLFWKILGELKTRWAEMQR